MSIGDIIRSKQPDLYKYLRWRYPEPEITEDKREYKENSRDMRHSGYKREHGVIRQTRR